MTKDFVRFSILYDIYGNLLTKRQKEVIDLYYNENMSLAEIAEEFDISRQAVHDTLSIAEKALKTYDEKLKLVECSKQREELSKEACRKIESILQKRNDDKKLVEAFMDIKKIIETIGG